jgi:hypothetical protein
MNIDSLLLNAGYNKDNLMDKGTGMDPLITASLIKAGGGLLGLFGQDNPYEKYNKAGLGWLQQNLNRDPVNVDALRSKAIATAIPNVNKRGAALNKRYGKDSGYFQKSIAQFLLDNLTNFDLNQAPGIQMGNAQYKSTLARTLAGAGGY